MDLFPDNSDEIVSVVSALHMVEAKSVQELMHDGSVAEASDSRSVGLKVEDLCSSGHAYVGVAARVTDLECKYKQMINRDKVGDAEKFRIPWTARRINTSFLEELGNHNKLL